MSSSTIILPSWLESLLTESFFNPCMLHDDAKKNDKNIFCVDCCQPICHHCLHLHNSHRLLQIRRYMYHDVIKVGDAEKLMDCSYVQAYTTNNAKVVFLNPRPQTRACRNLSNNCLTCDRGLQDPYLFCSVYCKIHDIMRSEGMMSEYLHECEILTLPEQCSDDWLITPETVIESFAIEYTTTTSREIVRKKRSSKSESPAAETTVNRRKGMPQRSPLN